MEKNKADAVITEYLKKIYGFSCKKTFSYDEAEDLAAEMTMEVYRSLLARDDVINTEGYIWRICEHTYARYVSINKKHRGISIDEIADIPYHDHFMDDSAVEEKKRLRREIAFLSAQRRQIMFRFYYKKESVRWIASQLHIPEGTVKWHLNKARNELKEGLSMERKIGALGIDPVAAVDFGHNGNVGENNGPEYYLGDRLSLNIVYSVYSEPKNIREIAEELGITPVFAEDKIALLENNGYLVKTKDGRHTTYVRFSRRSYSREMLDHELMRKQEAARVLVKEYVPLVRAAAASALEGTECFIPGGNRQLPEAAAIFYAVQNLCALEGSVPRKKLEKYYISDLCGGRYIAYAELKKECSDPDYEMKYDKDFSTCGPMMRRSMKYPSVQSWSVDSRLDSRQGGWKNNLTEDYEYLYEYMTGSIGAAAVHAEKIKRLQERGMIDDKGHVRIMVCKGTWDSFFDCIPAPDEAIKEKFAVLALENAMQEAKYYPPQMQDLILYEKSSFFDTVTALMVLDLLYDDGILTPLSGEEKNTANLIMFSDVLPKT